MPTIEGPFEINHFVIQIFSSFHGLEYENPFKHVNKFLEICSSFLLSNISADAFHLHLFLFSLKDKVKDKYHHLGSNAKGILQKFFAIKKLIALRRATSTFSQNKNEQLHEIWEMFKELLQSCPHLELPMWKLA